MDVTIVGRGRVGRGLSRALARTEGLVEPKLTAGRAPRGPFRDTIVLAVPDPAIADVAAALAPRVVRNAVILHCSGSLGVDALGACADRGCAVGAMHPLVSFADPKRPPALEGTSFVLGGDPRAVKTAARIARAVGARPVRADVHGPAYHAAAALSANGAAALAAVAVRVLEGLGLDARSARRAIGGLIRTVGENVERVGVPDALSGPVIRGDARTVARHRSALQALDPEARAAYDAVAPAILDCARRAGLDEDAAGAVRRALRRRLR